MKPANPAPTLARGFSLVELMVAVAISLIVLGGVIAVMVSSKATYTQQDSLARLQENARFAIEFIARDLRRAGYFGCVGDLTRVHNNVNYGNGNAPPNDQTGIGDLWDTTKPIEGLDHANQAKWFPSNDDWLPGNGTANEKPAHLAPNTDAFGIRGMSPAAAEVQEPYMPQESAALHLNTGNGLRKGDIVLVTDCSDADVFQITNPSDPSLTGTLNHNTGNVAGVNPGNWRKELHKTYAGDAFIAKLDAARYYIGVRMPNGNLCTANCKCDSRHRCGLFRQGMNVVTATGTPTSSSEHQEVVEGIENLQLLFGEVLSGGTRIPEVYVKADEVTNWANVVSVRISVLAYSIADTDYTRDNSGKISADGTGSMVKEFGGTTDAGPHTLLGTVFSQGNDNLEPMRVQRRVFEATVSLRNRRH